MKRFVGLLCVMLACFGQLQGDFQNYKKLIDEGDDILSENITKLLFDNDNKDFENVVVLEYLLNSSSYYGLPYDNLTKMGFNLKKQHYLNALREKERIKPVDISAVDDDKTLAAIFGLSNDMAKSNLANNMVIVEQVLKKIDSDLYSYEKLLLMRWTDKQNAFNGRLLVNIEDILENDLKYSREQIKALETASATALVTLPAPSVEPTKPVEPKKEPAKVEEPLAPLELESNAQKVINYLEANGFVVSPDQKTQILLSSGILGAIPLMVKSNTPAGGVAQKLFKDGIVTTQIVMGAGPKKEPTKPEGGDDAVGKATGSTAADDNLKKLITGGVIFDASEVKAGTADEALGAYTKMLNLGLPAGAVNQKMQKDGVLVAGQPTKGSGEPKKEQPKPTKPTKPEDGNGAGGKAKGGDEGGKATGVSANAQRVLDLAGDKLSADEKAVLANLNDDQLSIVNRLDAIGLLKLDIDGVLKDLRKKKLLSSVPVTEGGAGGKVTGGDEGGKATGGLSIAMKLLNNATILAGLSKEQQLALADQPDTKLALLAMSLDKYPVGVLNNLKQQKWMPGYVLPIEKSPLQLQWQEIDRDILSLNGKYKGSVNAMASPPISSRVEYLVDLRNYIRENAKNASSFNIAPEAVMAWLKYVIKEIEGYVFNSMKANIFFRNGANTPLGLRFDDIARSGVIPSNYTLSEGQIEEEDEDSDSDWDDVPAPEAEVVVDIPLPNWIVDPFRQTLEKQKGVAKKS